MSKSIYRGEEGKQMIQSQYEAYLKSMGVGFQRVFVETRFGKTHMLIAGPERGKPLFILQGGNCINPMTLSWFSGLFENYRIYAPDTIGHPGYSDQQRISATDDSFALWVSDLMDYFQMEKSAFVGPSYGGGIILRLAAFLPNKIACAVLLSPAGVILGSKWKMIQKILLPMLLFKTNSSRQQLMKVTNAMSQGSMAHIDQEIIGNIFRHVKLEQDMPKLTEKRELLNYSAPTMVLAGEHDIFFPSGKVIPTVKAIIPNLIKAESYDMGHFPSKKELEVINKEIQRFLEVHY